VGLGESGDGLVGGEHELLDELMTFIVLDFFEAVGVALGVHEDLGLGHVEVEGAVGHAVVTELAREFPELAHPFLEVGELGVGERGQRAAGGTRLVFGREGKRADLVEAVLEQERVGLFVSEALAAANDGVGERVGLRAALGVEHEEDGLRQPVLRLDQRAEPVGKFLRQHRNHRADEVSGVATALGLLVEGGAGLHVGGDVGDVDADADVAVVEVFE